LLVGARARISASAPFAQSAEMTTTHVLAHFGRVGCQKVAISRCGDVSGKIALGVSFASFNAVVEISFVSLLFVVWTSTADCPALVSKFYALSSWAMRNFFATIIGAEKYRIDKTTLLWTDIVIVVSISVVVVPIVSVVIAVSISVVVVPIVSIAPGLRTAVDELHYRN